MVPSEIWVDFSESSRRRAEESKKIRDEDEGGKKDTKGPMTKETENQRRRINVSDETAAQEEDHRRCKRKEGN